MIQIITYDISKYKDYSDKVYKISKLGEIQALDDFEICIVDLSNEYIWRYNGSSPTNVNCYRDLITIKEAIINSNTTKIVIVFPQNKKFSYNQTYEFIGGSRQYSFEDSIQLKDNKINLMKIINNSLFKLEKLELAFEKTKTVCEAKSIDADFNFINYKEEKFESVTYSKNSNKVTTIKKNNIFLTTLNILKDMDILKLFIENYCIDNIQKEEIPDWINNIKFFDDEQLNQNKDKNLTHINELKQENIEIDKKLKKNLEYKSILYTNGDELVEVVMSILDEILDYDSTGFIDKGKEDFLIKKEDITFIGEIKGVSSAIANKNVSQLDVHVQSYLDVLQENGTEEKVKGLLIINHQRNKQLDERQEVHEHQVNLAKRNGSLIIETKTLLKIFEKYKLGEISKEKCKKLFEDNVGLLEM